MLKWIFIIVGVAALSGAAGVIEAALAAHTIASSLLQLSANTLTVSAAAVIGMSAFAQAQSRRWGLVGATLLLVGTLFFCGELSTHVLLGRPVFGIAAPIGGMTMIAGWTIAGVDALAAALLKPTKIVPGL